MCRLKLYQFLLLILIGGFIISCSNSVEVVNNEVEIDEVISEKEDLNKAKQVFYSLPSPIETAMLIKRAGAKYDPNILNDVKDISNYNTTFDKAINLGIYGADLSFVSMFNQSQSAIYYLSATKRLADDLGILNAVDQQYIERMENNVNNRDSFMSIITETFMNSNAAFKENNRSELAAIVMAGGWLEGLYMAMEVTKNSDTNQELKGRILDQRLSLTSLLSLLSMYKDDSNVQVVLKDLTRINEIFESISVTVSEIKTVVDEETNNTSLESVTESTFSQEDFRNLSSVVTEIRNSYTK